MSTNHMTKGNYVEALQTLQTIIVNVDNVEKLLCLFDRAECQIKLKQCEIALVTANEILSLIETNSSSNEFKNSIKKIELNVENLVQSLNHIQQTDFLILLVKCWIVLVKTFFEQHVFLSKLETICLSISNITTELINQVREKEIKEYFPLMDEILEIIKCRPTKDVDLKMKCNSMANIMQIYGSCCNDASDWSKSIEIHNKAITMKETACTDKEHCCQMLGHCYNNTGRAYSNLKKTEKARSCFEKAVRIYRNATDYESEAARQSDLRNSQQNLDLVDKKEAVFSPWG